MPKRTDNQPPDDRNAGQQPPAGPLLEGAEAVSRLFDTLPAPAVITRASDGTVLAINQAFQDLTGYSPDQILGRSVVELKWWPDLEARNRLLQVLEREGRVHFYPTQIPDASGRLRDTWLAANWMDWSGERCIVTIALDVTDVLERQRALVAREEQQRLVLHEVSDALFIADERGNVLDVNPAGAALLGYSRDEVLGKSLATFILPEDREREPLLASWLAPGESRISRCRLRRKDGSEVTVEINARRLSDNRRVAVVRDLTERAALEAQIREAQKMEAIGRLAAGIAHDFNNLLTVIISSAQLLLESLEDETSQQDVREILDAANRAALLTRQLLAFSRRQSAEPEVLNPNEVLRNTEQLLRRVIGEEITLSLELKSSGHVYIDPGQLDQVIMNLVVNARDAMPRGGKLTLSTSDVSVPAGHPAGVPEGEYVLIAVKDTGVGMTPDILEHIFEPFFTTKPAGHGTGLGLATVYGILAQHGGYIRVESRPGQGSTFYIYLPRTESQAERPAPVSEAKAQAEQAAAEGATILVVEDDPAVRNIIRAVLQRSGYRVLAFGSPQEVLEA